MQRSIEVECSKYTPNARWVYGSEFYAVTMILEYPQELDELEDEELAELAGNEDARVHYVDA